MNLTEPHCGTDLGLLKTRAEPNPDGSYALSRTKIFISSGEHDLAENIIHLVLAKVTGALDNVKGISAVRGAQVSWSRRRVGRGTKSRELRSIEKKMGIHGNPTCVLNYDGAKGWLVGEPEKGLAAMFIMMNAARWVSACRGCQAESPTRMPWPTPRSAVRAGPGRDQRDPDAKADRSSPSDVRRMLMEMKSFLEGARALVCGERSSRPFPPCVERGRAAGSR